MEGKFGEGKGPYGLGRIRARLRATSETVIALQLDYFHKLYSSTHSKNFLIFFMLI